MKTANVLNVTPIPYQNAVFSADIPNPKKSFVAIRFLFPQPNTPLFPEFVVPEFTTGREGFHAVGSVTTSPLLMGLLCLSVFEVKPHFWQQRRKDRESRDIRWSFSIS